jgi:micrococcal nuclease
MKAKIIITGIVLMMMVMMLINGCASHKSTAFNQALVKVERVVDGDTIEIKLGGKKEKVRLIGIDTPETKKPNTPVMYYGKEASAYTKKRLEQQTISLEWDVDRRDKYDRLLAYVWIDNELFNETLIKEGYARLSTFPPNVKYVSLFTKAQEQARKQGSGIWQDYNSAFNSKK